MESERCDNKPPGIRQGTVGVPVEKSNKTGENSSHSKALINHLNTVDCTPT
jgi:hypothetical protein